ELGPALGAQLELKNEADVEFRAIRKAGQGVQQRELAQLRVVLLTDFAVDDVAGYACANDDQRNAGHRKGQRMQRRRIREISRYGGGRDVKRGHPSEMQADDRDDQRPGRDME